MPDPTEPPTAPDEESSLARQTLDMLVYAPVGLVVTAVEDLPTLAARGRSALTQTFRNAHLIGQFTVSMGRRELDARLARRAGFAGSARPAHPPAVGEAGDAPAPGRPERGAGPRSGAQDAPRAADVLRPAEGLPEDAAGTEPTTVDLAIPGYDSLSASQVVRRLDGLGTRELEAVYRHESAGRHRRTILHRAQQLLGLEPTPGTPEQTP